MRSAYLVICVFCDHPSDELGDLRYDGVSESPKSVHPSGNPMSHSTHVGFSFPPMLSGSAVATAFSRFCGFSEHLFHTV